MSSRPAHFPGVEVSITVLLHTTYFTKHNTVFISGRLTKNVLSKSKVKVKIFYLAKTNMFIAINNTYEKAWSAWTKHDKPGKY